MALFVFVGSLIGSLLGAAADLGEAIGTLEQLQAVFNPTLCIVGSNTVLGEGIGMADEWAVAFEAVNPVHVDVSGIGSVNGVGEAASGGCVNVLAMSEPITEAQQNQLAVAGVEIECAAEIGYDVIAFVTDINNEIHPLRDGQLISILRGATDNWHDIGGLELPITILARPGSGTTEFVLLNFAYYTPTAENPFPEGAPYFACASNSACLDDTLATPGSLYWVSTAWLRTQPTEYLQVIPILQGDEAPINPLDEDVRLEDYHPGLVRALYMYVLRGPNTDPEADALAREFVSYVRSVQGQRILEGYQFFNHFDRPPGVDLELPLGFSLVSAGGPRQMCR